MACGVARGRSRAVVGAEGLAEVRTALERVFAKFTLVRTPENGLSRIPEVAVLDEIEAWVQLPNGRPAVSQALKPWPGLENKEIQRHVTAAPDLQDSPQPAAASGTCSGPFSPMTGVRCRASVEAVAG